MPPRLRLLRINPKDTAEVLAFVRFVNAHYRGSHAFTPNEATQPQARFFWVQSGQSRVGTAGFVLKTPYLAETVKTVVDKAHRGKGIGEWISSAIEREARRAGVKKVMTTIFVDNLPMVFIKLKQGYLIEGLSRDHEAPGFDEYLLGKHIT